MKEVKLTKGQIAFVDDEDFEFVSKYHWQACPSSDGFKAVSKSGNGPTIFLHRLVMNTPKGMVCDHIDHNQLNCLKSNLRNCKQRQNGRNRRKTFRACTSKFKGVYWDKLNCKWRVHIRFKGQTFEVGSFEVEEIAALAYNKVAVLCFGEFAEINKDINPELQRMFDEADA